MRNDASIPQNTTLFTGTAVSRGRVIGKTLSMSGPIQEPSAQEKIPSGSDEATEAQRIKDAAHAVKENLRERADQASGEAQQVLKATALMAADPALAKSAIKLVSSEGMSAERAIWQAAEAVAAQLAALGGYMAERVADIKDVRARIVAQLRGEQAPGIPESHDPFILIAEDLAPADTATLDPQKILALVTSEGGPQSHTAILARQLGLPAVVAASGVENIPDGTEVFVDAAEGTLSTEVSAENREAAEAYARIIANPLTFDGNGRLSDGVDISLRANIGSAADARAAASLNAQGVGLLRTEFLFLDRDDEPTIEEQTRSYTEIFSAFEPTGSSEKQKIVVRTLDAGADKPLPFLTEAGEPNPALGVRGFRTHTRSREVLTNQLQAIAAAVKETGADVWVMAPMISTVSDAELFAALCREAGLEHAGVMVEVPSAAIRAEFLLKKCDFASIGTNDLTQYTMAADRQLGSLAELNDPWQPAVLELIKSTHLGAVAVEALEGTPRPVGVCGEAAGDPALAVVLVGLGVSSLSMTARSLAPVAHVLASVDLKQARALAALALQAPDAVTARSQVRAGLPILTELGL